jgi:chaperone BCS1
LIRPGRIDVKIQYNLATKEQTRALFFRFFPESQSGLQAGHPSTLAPTDLSEKGVESDINVSDLADSFTGKVPESEFSTAELQGYLLQHKNKPRRAVDGIQAWVDEERQARREKEEREQARKNKLKKAKGMDGPVVVRIEGSTDV